MFWKVSLLWFLNFCTKSSQFSSNPLSSHPIPSHLIPSPVLAKMLVLWYLLMFPDETMTTPHSALYQMHKNLYSVYRWDTKSNSPRTAVKHWLKLLHFTTNIPWYLGWPPILQAWRWDALFCKSFLFVSLFCFCLKSRRGRRRDCLFMLFTLLF